MKKALLLAALVSACSSAPAEDPNDDVIVENLDFYSASAKEYFVSGTSTVTVEANAPDKMKRARELVTLKNVAISWFLNQYLIDKEHDDANASYGGFKALTRFDSEENDKIELVSGTTYRFNYKVQVAG